MISHRRRNTGNALRCSWTFGVALAAALVALHWGCSADRAEVNAAPDQGLIRGMEAVETILPWYDRENFAVPFAAAQPPWAVIVCYGEHSSRLPDLMGVAPASAATSVSSATATADMRIA